MSVRSYSVTMHAAVPLPDQQPRSLSTTVLAQSYGNATQKGCGWADKHADHGQYGPWTATRTEVC